LQRRNPGVNCLRLRGFWGLGYGRPEAKRHQVNADSLVIQHVGGTRVGIAKVLGNVALLERIYNIVIKCKPRAKCLYKRDIVSMVWAAV
jgi:hypothetical protein